MRSDDKRDKSRPGATKVLAMVLDHIAEEVAADINSEPTEADRRWAREEHAKMQVRIAEMRRQHTLSHAVIGPAVPISPAIRAMVREELLAQLEAVSHSRAVQYAHCNLTGLTDDDLRQMLAVLVRQNED
jgi:hypothetical protein